MTQLDDLGNGISSVVEMPGLRRGHCCGLLVSTAPLEMKLPSLLLLNDGVCYPQHTQTATSKNSLNIVVYTGTLMPRMWCMMTALPSLVAAFRPWRES